MPFPCTTLAASRARSGLPRAFVILFAALLLSGCASASLSPTKISTVSPYNACLQRCGGVGEQSAFVRDGCRRGCELALELFPLRGSHYASQDACIEAVDSLDKTHALRWLENRCKSTWAGEDRRAGCKEAGDAFYGAVTKNMCISDMP